MRSRHPQFEVSEPPTAVRHPLRPPPLPNPNGIPAFSLGLPPYGYPRLSFPISPTLKAVASVSPFASRCSAIFDVARKSPQTGAPLIVANDNGYGCAATMRSSRGSVVIVAGMHAILAPCACQHGHVAFLVQFKADDWIADERWLNGSRTWNSKFQRIAFYR